MNFTQLLKLDYERSYFGSGRNGQTRVPFCRNLSAFLAAEDGFNEGVNSSIHNVLDVSGFFACAEILDHLVGLENIGTDLAAPANFPFIGVRAVGFGFLLVFLDLVEFGS